jgi:hypothetical protein
MMLQQKPGIKSLMSSPQTLGEKLITVLRQPLITFPISFPEKKKPLSPGRAKTIHQKKTLKQNRPVPVKKVDKPLPARNASTESNAISYVFSLLRNREEYEKILFTLRACDRNNGRAFTNVLHVEHAKNGSRLIATDGKRMHVTEIGTRIKPGDYKPVVTKEKIKLKMPVPNVSFPNWERVVPANVVRRGCINLENAAISENGRVNSSFTRMTGEEINPSFLSDLTRKPWVVYCQNEKRKALLLKEYRDEGKTYAVIMPLSA